jgi:hypothetical protein
LSAMTFAVPLRLRDGVEGAPSDIRISPCRTLVKTAKACLAFLPPCRKHPLTSSGSLEHGTQGGSPGGVRKLDASQRTVGFKLLAFTRALLR